MSLSFSRIHKETCFLFQLGETLNPELQIITSVFNKVIHRGEYDTWSGGKRKTLFSSALFLNQAGNSVVILASLLRNITLACILSNDAITFFPFNPRNPGLPLDTAIAFLLCMPRVHLAAISSYAIYPEMILSNFQILFYYY